MLLIVCTTASAAREPPAELAGFVKLEGVEPTEAYRRAKHWLAERVVTTREDITLEDGETRTVVGRGSADFYLAGFPAQLSYSCTLTAKDNGVAWRFAGFRVWQMGSSTERGPALSNSGTDKKIRKKLEPLIRDLEAGVRDSK